MLGETDLPPSVVVGVIGNAVFLADGRVYHVSINNGNTTVPCNDTYVETIPGTVAAAAVKKARGY